MIHEEAVVCVKCGRAVENANIAVARRPADDSMQTVIKVFMILGCIAEGWLIIPLAWCIPITVCVFKALNEGRPIGTGLKVCSLLFVSLIAGICMLCLNDE